MSWSRFAAEVPELARLCRSRLEKPGVALLGTLRRDGSPRIDPVEPHFAGDELVLGVMRHTAKARALRRDPRCVLHSTVGGPNTGETDVKLSGHVDPSIARAGWWAERPAEEVEICAFQIEEATAVEWDLAASRMTIRRWSPGMGETVTERAYP
jgi:hypothetical protein